MHSLHVLLFEMFSSGVKLIFLVVIEISLTRAALKNFNFEISEVGVAKYMSSLISFATAKDCTRNHHVTFIRYDMGSEEEIFNAIVSEVLRFNFENPVYIHSAPGKIPLYRVHTTSVFIISIRIERLVFHKKI